MGDHCFRLVAAGIYSFILTDIEFEVQNLRYQEVFSFVVCIWPCSALGRDPAV